MKRKIVFPGITQYWPMYFVNIERILAIARMEAVVCDPQVLAVRYIMAAIAKDAFGMEYGTPMERFALHSEN